MRIYLQVFIAAILLSCSFEAWAQPCNSTPNVNSATATNITATTATLGGTASDDGGSNCDIIETGVEWATVSGGPYTTVIGSDIGTGTFTVDVTGLPAATQIFYRAYGRNQNTDPTDQIDYTGTLSFYTLATSPSTHAATLTATTVDKDKILLQFPAASAIPNADGYVILIENGSNPNLNNLNDGSVPTLASDYAHLLSNTTDTQYTVSGLDAGITYYFTIIPYNREGDDDTYNYLNDMPGYPLANATTPADVDIDAETSGLASSPLNDGTVDRALVGFSLNASGPVQFQGVVIHLSSTTTGKFSNFRLCESSNATFSDTSNDPPLTSGVTLTITDTEITITLAESLTAATDRFFFLVADVASTVNTNTPAVQLSYNENDFTFSPQSIDGTVSQSRNYTFADVNKPVLLSIIPADNATGVDFNTSKLTLTFNENVENIGDPASTNAHRVIIYDAATDVAVATISRASVNANGSPVVEVDFPAGSLQPNSDYYVLIGNAVIEDIPADLDWDGITNVTAWNFSTSGVVVNNATSNICSGSFQSIADIIISEEAVGDFLTSGTINLDFANADFGYDISSVTVTAGAAGTTDISSIQLSPRTLTRLTLDYTLDGTNDKVDVITISGLKVYASAPGATTIVNGSSIAGVWAADAPITFATIDVGSTTPSAPVLEAMQDLLICQKEVIYDATVAVVNDGGTFNWYNNASLSVQMASGFQVNIQDDLDIDSSVVGTVKRYVVRVDGCQSTPLEVTFEVAPIPGADAGPASANICSGSSITLGGAPTLIGPSVSGAYQYLWSTNPANGFTDMGPNPVVSPTYHKDTTFQYTVKIIDANNCSSDTLDVNAMIAVQVDSTDEVIVYNSPLSTSFTLNSDPIELSAEPSFSSTYSGSGVYLSAGKYYFDPDLAGTAGSPHTITYTTNLTNGCPRTETRSFAVSNSSATIVNLATSYCANEAPDPSKVLSLGTDWSNNLAANNAYYAANYGYTYEFYDFQAYTNSGTVGPGVVYPTPAGAYPDQQHIDPTQLQPYVPGSNYTYIGMRVRQKTENTLLGIPLGTYSYGPPIFWSVQYANLFSIPALKVRGVSSGQIICDINEVIDLEANFETGTFEISRDGVNWVSGPSVGLIDLVNTGKAQLNPHNAYISTGFPAPNAAPASGVTNFYVRYTYVVLGTSGSDSNPCQNTLIIPFKISNNPAVAWNALAQTEFCYEAANVQISTNPATGIQLSGYGIFDNGNGTAVFDPDEGLKAKAFGTNSPPYTDYNTPEDIIISATRTDVNGCFTTIQQTVEVRPLFPASFTASDFDVCYEDGTQTIVGDQPNGSYTLSHANLNPAVVFNQTTINNFNLRTYFNDAVADGADGTVTQKFDLTFNTFDPGLGCQNSITKTFNVNPPLEMNIVGMDSGMVVCGNGVPLSLTGNRTGAGSFEISDISGSTGFVSEAFGLDNTGSGYAVFTPAGAGLAPGSPQKPYFIRYSYLGPGCVLPAQTTEAIVINPQPQITFSSSNPAANTQYCFEQATSPTTVILRTNESSNVTITGFGITDNGGGESVFNPTAAYQQSSLEANQNPFTDQTIRNIQITATRSDAASCTNTAAQTYIVNPLPKANFSPAQSEYCYEDNSVIFEGLESNVTYQYVYKSTTTPTNYMTAVLPGPTTSFDPSTFFDDAVAKGANPLATLQFDIIYTAINSTTGCTNQLVPVALTVSPRIPVAISGVEDNEIFCSNVTDKILEFSPPGGTFRINGSTEPYSNNQYTFSPVIDGPASGTDYTFSYTLITGKNCTNSLEKIVKVLPSPRALFDVVPQCDTALIPYDAQTLTNLASTTYTWNFSGEVKAGQNVEHRFPGVSSYYAKLKVEHPPFQIGPDQYLVCSDSLQLDQVVGPYPRDIQFEYFNVCEGDNTNFEVSSSVPINRVSWDFGDGESSPFGILSENITGLPQTTGTYQNPVHTFNAAFDNLTVRLVGKTADNFGGCPSAYEAQISILKKWAPTAAEPSYNMSMLDNGKGFWVMEDKEGNATWEFNTAAKSTINTNEMAWVTGAAVPYNGNDVSYVNSPCFDLSSLSRPVISIKHWTDTEPSDGAVLQYSIDGGDTWDRLGEVASGLDWYNRLTISSNPGEQDDLSSGWSLNSQEEWAVGKHTLDVLPPQRSKVRLRVAFASFNNREQRDGFAFNNVVIEERNRTILVENFTTLNAAQDANNTAYNNFRALDHIFNPAELVKLQYHHSPAQNNLPPDELNLDNPTDPNARAAFYGITTPVRAFVDGGFGQSSSNATFQSPALSPYFGLRSLVTSPVTIAIDFENEPSDKLNVKATVKAIDELTGTGQYNVFIAIAERQIITTEQDTALYVLRKFLPDPSGTALTLLSMTDPAQEINVSYDMRHVTRLPDGTFAPFAVIVFVQNLQTKEVLQTVLRQDGMAPAQVVTGIETPFDSYVTVYPNPADEVLNIILPAPVRTETPLRVFDTFGRQVYSGTFKKGEHVRAIETKPFAAGIYLIQLSTPEGEVRKKAMVVHE